MKSTLMIPITIYGMQVSYIDGDVVSTKDFPYRKKITDVRKDFGDPNGYQILGVKSTKQEYEVNYQDFVSGAKLLGITVNKNGVIQ